MPFFSVIIPVYDGENTVEKTLNSVIAQTFTDFEIILVNDGSTDATGSILRSFKKKHSALAITLIEQENTGLGAARNAGIKAAYGKYCALLDADDLWKPQKLELLHNVIEKQNDPELIYHPVITFGLTEQKKRKAYPVHSIEDILLKGNPIVPSAVLLRTDVARNFPFSKGEDFHGAEDILLWVTLLKSGYRFYYYPTPLSMYREEGGMSTRLDEHLKKVLHVFQHFHEEEWITENLLERSKRRKLFEAARFYHKRGKHQEAAWYYSSARIYSLKALLLRTLNSLRIAS